MGRRYGVYESFMCVSGLDYAVPKSCVVNTNSGRCINKSHYHQNMGTGQTRLYLVSLLTLPFVVGSEINTTTRTHLLRGTIGVYFYYVRNDTKLYSVQCTQEVFYDIRSTKCL